MDRALTRADEIAGEMKDEFLSVEHLFLGLIDAADSTLKKLFQTYHITKEAALNSLSQVRGNQRVTSDNPEETYDALKNTASTWWNGQSRTSWIQSSAETMKSVTSSVSCPVRRKITLCSSANPASVRPPW